MPTQGRPELLRILDRCERKANGCLVFRGAKTYFGHGLVRSKQDGVSRCRLAHRVVFILRHGSIPKGKVILHTCDDPACLEDKHHKLGTQSDNVKAQYQRGRRKCPRCGHKF